MGAFRNYSITKKLMSMSLWASIGALLLATMAFMGYDFLTYRTSLVQSLSTLGEIISFNTAPAVVFNDTAAAMKSLASLKAKPSIMSAGIYTSNGRLFAQWQRDEKAPHGIPPLPSGADESFHFRRQTLVLFHPMILDRSLIGMVYMESDLSDIARRLRHYAGISVAVLSLAIIVAAVISFKVGQKIAEPILHLTDTAQAVSERKDYSVRAQGGGLDEIGLLVRTFNAMLTKIQEDGRLLQESAARKGAILDAAMDCIITMDEQGNIVDFNPSAEKTFQRKHGDVAGKSLANTIIPLQFREQHGRGLERYIKTGEGPVLNKRIELPAMRADGTEFPMELSISAIQVDGHSLFTAYLRDVTERKQDEARISRLSAIVESSSDAIIGKSLQGNIESWNKSAERIYGYSAQEVVGKSIAMLLPLDRIGEFQTLTARIQRGDTVNAYETVRRRKDGVAIDISLTLSPIKDASGNLIGISAIERDIRERKRADAEIHKLNESLEQKVQERTTELTMANKELEAFSYSVSHDLRAPLRHIGGFTELLAKNPGLKGDASAGRYLSIVSDSVRQMGALIDDLLSFSRMGRAEMLKSRVDLGAMMREIIQDFKPQTEARDVQWKVASLPEVQGDPAMLRVVCVNLLSNALKYSRGRAPAVIEVGLCDAPDKEKIFFVRDNGTGFDMKYVDKLFGVFQRLHTADEFEGTGIGLATVRRIIHRHGGRAWAEGMVDRGATFYVALPFEQKESSHG